MTADTMQQQVRRGLPRTPGGQPWPAARTVTATTAVGTSGGAHAAPVPGASDAGTVTSETVEAVGATPTDSRRRGLPRVAGGKPWPPASVAAGTGLAASAVPAAAPSPTAAATVAANASGPVEDAGPAAPSTGAAAPVRTAAAVPAGEESGWEPVTGRRRGLPRTPGGDPYPPGRYRRVQEARADTSAAVPTSSGSAAPSALEPDQPAARRTGDRRGQDAVHTRSEPSPQARSWRRFGLIAFVGLVALALAILGARWFLGTEPGAALLARYPGETHLPDWASPGIPAWVGWQHFFNMFFLVLIIRTGITVRRETRPPATVTPHWPPNAGKISLTLWLHLALDVLWLLNGLVFIILLFTTGHWVRIVPLTWEVFPNAVAAGLQYLALDWPTENGWVNYNSLQQLAYFTTVFIAAPVAILSGVRMSMFWPKDAGTLNRAYPVEAARALHFPTMLYFVFFIVTHVAMVLATGALRNLNHMYASADVINWWGAGIFALSLLVIVGAWFLLRPAMVASVASVFGRVGR